MPMPRGSSSFAKSGDTGRGHGNIKKVKPPPPPRATAEDVLRWLRVLPCGQALEGAGITYVPRGVFAAEQRLEKHDVSFLQRGAKAADILTWMTMNLRDAEEVLRLKRNAQLLLVQEKPDQNSSGPKKSQESGLKSEIEELQAEACKLEDDIAHLMAEMEKEQHTEAKISRETENLIREAIALEELVKCGEQRLNLIDSLQEAVSMTSVPPSISTDKSALQFLEDICSEHARCLSELPTSIRTSQSPQPTITSNQPESLQTREASRASPGSSLSSSDETLAEQLAHLLDLREERKRLEANLDSCPHATETKMRQVGLCAAVYEAEKLVELIEAERAIIQRKYRETHDAQAQYSDALELLREIPARASALSSRGVQMYDAVIRTAQSSTSLAHDELVHDLQSSEKACASRDLLMRAIETVPETIGRVSQVHEKTCALKKGSDQEIMQNTLGSINRKSRSGGLDIDLEQVIKYINRKGMDRLQASSEALAPERAQSSIQQAQTVADRLCQISAESENVQNGLLLSTNDAIADAAEAIDIWWDQPAKAALSRITEILTSEPE